MPKLADVNTTDIADAIRLGCRSMSSIFNADDNDIPFFQSRVWPEASFAFASQHTESHVPGRHLNALLNAEDAAGIAIDERAIERHAAAAFFSYGGPLALPLNREKIGGPLVNFCPHNIREGFHALYALVKYRGSDRAREIAAGSIEAIFDLWDSQRGWDERRIGDLGLTYRPCPSFIQGVARTIGPLVKYYRATDDARALELANLLRRKAVEEFYQSDGRFIAEEFGTTHVHSITCVLSSLAQLADATDDSRLMDRVRAFYDSGLRQIRDELGWTPESTRQENSDHGEANNTGDILETALILGRWFGCDYYHDAERILRGHLLPCQLRDISFIAEPENPGGLDSLRDVGERHRGGFGFPAPYGHESIANGRLGEISFNLDIVGGSVGSLCEAYRDVVGRDETGHRVNLLFDHEADEIKVESPYTHEALRILPRRQGRVSVRIPPWVDRRQMSIEGAGVAPDESDGYLVFEDVPAGRALTIHFPLVEQEITLSPELHVHPIRVKLRGDAVAAMENFGANFTYFDPLT